LHETTVDYIYYATGINSNVNDLPYLQTMHSKHTIETLGGLPVLTQDLMWRENLPLFVIGKLAGLRLGPGAGNLEGARVGAERAVWGIQDVLGKVRKSRAQEGSEKEATEVIEEKEDGQKSESDVEDQAAYRYCAGLGSRFASLDV